MSRPKRIAGMATLTYVGGGNVGTHSTDIELLRRVVTHLVEKGTRQLSKGSHMTVMTRGATMSSVLSCAIREFAEKLGVR